MTPIPISKVLEWLDRTGYPLELRTGRACEEAGWVVTYSSWYTDSQTAKPRELDVLALTWAHTKAGHSTGFGFCIECKSSPDKPWVGFHSGAQYGENGHFGLYKGEMAGMAVVAANTERIPFPGVLPKSAPRVGGLVQALGAKDDNAPSSPHSALMQACAAVRSLDRSRTTMSRQSSPPHPSAAVILPLLVFDGQLMLYSLSRTEPQLREVDCLLATVPGDNEHEQALVPVMTLKYAQACMPLLHTEADKFCRDLLPLVSKIVGALSIEG